MTEPLVQPPLDPETHEHVGLPSLAGVFACKAA